MMEQRKRTVLTSEGTMLTMECRESDYKRYEKFACIE